ncbi:transposase [Streptomyces sp. NPDC058683]|uniref:transposase n=1 Tax=Streptomyces sp. NPDC058683 TaxID=3346597 RepID=UPI00365BBDA2
MRQQHDLLATIPGVSTRLAQAVIAETGANMTRLSTAAALASWRTVAPGNNRSTGRNYSDATTHSNVWLKVPSAMRPPPRHAPRAPTSTLTTAV